MDFQRADLGLLWTVVEKVPWEAVLERTAAREGWAYFYGSYFKSAGADRHRVMEDKLTGKEAGQAEQRPLAGTREQK